jgi:hypothetical protein
LRTARRAREKAISCQSSTKDSAEVGVRIAIGRPSRVTTNAPSAATLDKTAPGLELNSLEAIICIVATIAQQMPEANQKLSVPLRRQLSVLGGFTDNAGQSRSEWSGVLKGHLQARLRVGLQRRRQTGHRSCQHWLLLYPSSSE